MWREAERWKNPDQLVLGETSTKTRLKKLLESGFSFDQLKNFTLEHMSGEGYHVIDPTEVLVLSGMRDYFYEDYIRQRDQFFRRIWEEKIMPIITEEQFVKFLSRMNSSYMLGTEFMPLLEEYASKCALKN